MVYFRSCLRGIYCFSSFGSKSYKTLQKPLDLIKLLIYHKNVSNRWIIGIIVAVVVIVGGLFILNKNSSPSIPATSIPSQTETQPSTAQQDIITLTQDGFSPATFTIKAGVTVTWVNKSGNNAKVSSNPHPIHTNYPPLNLETFPDGEKLSLIFDKPGTYSYHNHLNPSQTGMIVVQ